MNRIGHGHYTIDNITYTTELNDGNNTLHSGTNNWSYRTWNVTDMSDTSITFSIVDASNSSLGMLGRVDASVTYSVDKSTWKISMKANSPDRKTRKHIIFSTFQLHIPLVGFCVLTKGLSSSPHAHSAHIL